MTPLDFKSYIRFHTRSARRLQGCISIDILPRSPIRPPEELLVPFLGGSYQSPPGGAMLRLSSGPTRHSISMLSPP